MGLCYKDQENHKCSSSLEIFKCWPHIQTHHVSPSPPSRRIMKFCPISIHTFLPPPELITFFLGSLHMPPNQSFCLWSLSSMVYSPLDHQINLSKPTFSSLNPLLIMFSPCSEIFSCSLKCPCVTQSCQTLCDPMDCRL